MSEVRGAVVYHEDMSNVVMHFTLPSTGERWNWPLTDSASVDAFVEILDRAGIAWAISSGRAAKFVSRPRGQA